MLLSTLTLSGQFLSFLTILGAGFVYITLSWALSHFLGDHADSHDADGHDGDRSHETVSIFSPKIVAIFMVGFGAGGSLATDAAFGVFGATLIGLLVGAGFGVLALLFMRFLYSQQATSCIPVSAAIGQPATVEIEIPSGGLGEVSLSVNGQHMTYTARHYGTASVRRGAVVKVMSTHGTSLVVS